MTSPTTDVLVAFIAAAAASLAALIAGGISLLGMLTSKEQKVSEFRQVWIDALRADIAGFVAHAHEIAAYHQMHVPLNASEAWAATRDDYLELNRSSIRIKFRLNPDEVDNQVLLNLMKEMEKLFMNLAQPKSVNELYKIVDALEQCAPPLLKKEWNRVKRGEPIYVVANIVTFVFFLVAVFVAICLFSKFLR